MKITYQGQQIEAQEVEVLTSNEPWNEYQLGNGKLLRVKTVLIQVFRAVEGKSPQGEDLYIIQSQNIVKVME